ALVPGTRSRFPGAAEIDEFGLDALYGEPDRAIAGEDQLDRRRRGGLAGDVVDRQQRQHRIWLRPVDAVRLDGGDAVEAQDGIAPLARLGAAGRLHLP